MPSNHIHDGREPDAMKCHDEWTTYIYQHDGYWLERVFETKPGHGGATHGSGSVLVEENKHDGVYQPPAKKALPGAPTMTTGEAKADREWQERLRVERSFNDTYSRERKA